MVSPTPHPLLIFPCNGNGIEAVECLGDQYRMTGFVDDTVDKQGTRVLGYPVFGREAILRDPHSQILAVPGSPTSYRRRRAIIDGLNVPIGRFGRVIHPGAMVSSKARIGRNVLIMAGVVVTSNAVISDHVCILPNSVIHHDTVIDRWTLIGSGVTIAGGCRVGENCYVGSGATIINGIDVGDFSLVGMGANVIRNVRQNSTVVGNPAHEINHTKSPVSAEKDQANK